MLRTLKDLFDNLTAPAAAPADADHLLQLATAVLLVEVMRADAEMPEAEKAAVLAGLREHFALADDELERLYELAQRASREATDFFGFTSRLNERFDAAQKRRIVEHLWRVAYADGRLGAHEQHVMWRIADLLHVPQRDYIAAKQGARDEAAGRAG